MKKGYILIFLLLLLILPKLVLAITDGDDLIVKYKSDKNIDNISHRYGVDSNNLEEIDKLNTFKIENPNLWQELKIYIDKNISKDIEFVEKNVEFQALTIPNDPGYQNQWALPKISADSAWNTAKGSENVIIAIVDTGINGTHEDLNGKVIGGYNALTETNIIPNSDSDDYGHGTSVSSVTAGVTNNSKGLAGVDWNSRLMPVKVLDSNGYGYSFDVAAGIIYAADHGAKVINLSLGGSTLSNTLKNAIDYASDQKRVLVVAASGNSNTDISYPAKYWKVLAVGATNQSDMRWYKSNFGPDLDVVAPGESIYNSSDSGGYRYSTGTSLAAPHVSGLAGLVFAKNPDYSNDQVKLIIQNNTDKLSAMGGSDFSNYYGYGRINLLKSINSIVSGNPYQSSLVSKNGNPTIVQGKGYNFHLQIKNTGTETWKKNIVKLGTSNPYNRETNFALKNLENQAENSHWISSNRIEMLEESVAPGEIATFSFWMSAPENMNPNVYREEFQILAEGVSWFGKEKIIWDVAVLSKEDAYKPCKFESQNSHPTLMPGDSYNFYLKMKNTGSQIWKKRQVNLGTDHPRDRKPNFILSDINNTGNSHWISSNRIEMLEESVAPGETATFSFWLSVPGNANSGVYREYFRMVADGITWMDDWGIYWDIRITRPHSIWTGQSGYPTIRQGEKANVWIDFKNTGDTIWKKTGYNPTRLGTNHPQDRASQFKGNNWLLPNRIQLEKDQVFPGETGRFSFEMNVLSTTPEGVYREYFRPVVDGVTWMEDNGVFLDVKVVK